MTATRNLSSDTPTRIVHAAMSALARHGSRKLSMSDIGEAAGVSRGTLYRYFKSKDDVLEAVGRYVHDGVRDAIAGAIAQNPTPGDRVRVILEVLVQAHGRFPVAEQMIEIETGFSLAFVRQSYPEFVEIVTRALEPAVDAIPIVRAGVLSARQLAVLILRVVTTTFFVPDTDSARVAEWMVSIAGLDAWT